MQNNKLSDSHFVGTTGYGYDDKGRDVLDDVYRDISKQRMLWSDIKLYPEPMLWPYAFMDISGRKMSFLAITGKPYDTLEEVIGLRGEGGGS